MCVSRICMAGAMRRWPGQEALEGKGTPMSQPPSSSVQCHHFPDDTSKCLRLNEEAGRVAAAWRRPITSGLRHHVYFPSGDFLTTGLGETKATMAPLSPTSALSEFLSREVGVILCTKSTKPMGLASMPQPGMSPATGEGLEADLVAKLPEGSLASFTQGAAAICGKV